MEEVFHPYYFLNSLSECNNRINIYIIFIHGAFFISVPENESYRSMEPVASHWEEHNALGQALIERMEEEGVPIYSSGSMAIDLTQTSYSTIPSVDLEVGDRGSSTSDETLETIASGIAAGVSSYFK